MAHAPNDIQRHYVMYLSLNLAIYHALDNVDIRVLTATPFNLRQGCYPKLSETLNRRIALIPQPISTSHTKGKFLTREYARNT